jgi:pilus assembly protein CpaB
MNARVTALKGLVRQDAMLVALALGCGIGGAWLAGHYLDSRAAATEAQLASRYTTRAVVVAASDIAAGDTVLQEKLAARRMPQEFLPADAVPPERAAELLGGRAAIAIRRGTPVVPAALHTGSGPPRLSALLAPGERALTVPVDEINSHAGGVEVGDHVDISYRRGRSGETFLLPLLQQVEVLATGATFQPDGGGEATGSERHYGTVTLRVGERDAARLLLAQAAGELSLLLRAPGDATVQAVVLRSSRELLQQGPAAARQRVPGTEVLTGGNGGTEPMRTWLSLGAATARPAGDAS